MDALEEAKRKAAGRIDSGEALALIAIAEELRAFREMLYVCDHGFIFCPYCPK